MTRNTRSARAFQRALGISAIVASSSGLPVGAQDLQQSPMAEVVVTGTRITTTEQGALPGTIHQVRPMTQPARLARHSRQRVSLQQIETAGRNKRGDVHRRAPLHRRACLPTHPAHASAALPTTA